MKSTALALFVYVAAFLAGPPCLRAERISEREALTIARNYVRFTLANEGRWGRAETAEVASIQPFLRGDRQLGYFCRVEPSGFLVLSLYRELAPVRAYSGGCNLDPDAEEGLTDLLKDKMEAILDEVDRRLARPLRPDDRIDGLLQLDYRGVTEVLVADAFDPEAYRQAPRPSRGAGMNYQEGDTLLVCNWHQQPPFNQQCPDLGCSWPDYNNFNSNARVGCVATAASQVMHHWHWPLSGNEPFGDTYNWANMCAQYNWDWAGWFVDENGVPVTWNQINAVAELCNEVGIAVDMEYGCSSSGTLYADIEGALEDYFLYADCAVDYRMNHPEPLDWFDIIKNEINHNRAIPYGVEDHTIVADGWKEEQIGERYYWYHMNYGWVGTGADHWYALDELYLGGFFMEAVTIGVRPASSIGQQLQALYPPAARYFDMDASGTNSTFQAGNGLQILKPGFLLRNTGSPAAAINLYGLPEAKTRFYLQGDLAGKTRINIRGGAMKIRGGGEVAVY